MNTSTQVGHMEEAWTTAFECEGFTMKLLMDVQLLVLKSAGVDASTIVFSALIRGIFSVQLHHRPTYFFLSKSLCLNALLQYTVLS